MPRSLVTRRSRRHPPWWAFLFLALAAYVGLKYGVPALIAGNPQLAGTVLLAVPAFAPLGAMVFLLAAAMLLYADPSAETASTDHPNGRAPAILSRPGIISLAAEAYRHEGYLVLAGRDDDQESGPDLVMEKDGGMTLVWVLEADEQPVPPEAFQGAVSLLAEQGGAEGIILTTGQFSAESAALGSTLPLTLVDGHHLEHFILAAGRSQAASTKFVPPS